MSANINDAVIIYKKKPTKMLTVQSFKVCTAKKVEKEKEVEIGLKVKKSSVQMQKPMLVNSGSDHQDSARIMHQKNNALCCN